jgi:hypothetical protein
MQILRTHTSAGAQPHYLYDLSLPLPERTHKRMLFASAMAVASFLGVTPSRIYISRAKKHRIWSEGHGGWFVVRIASTTKPECV